MEEAIQNNPFAGQMSQNNLCFTERQNEGEVLVSWQHWPKPPTKPD